MNEVSNLFLQIFQKVATRLDKLETEVFPSTSYLNAFLKFKINSGSLDFSEGEFSSTFFGLMHESLANALRLPSGFGTLISGPSDSVSLFYAPGGDGPMLGLSMGGSYDIPLDPSGEYDLYINGYLRHTLSFFTGYSLPGFILLDRMPGDGTSSAFIMEPGVVYDCVLHYRAGSDGGPRV